MASLGHNELNIKYPFPHIYQHPPPNIYQYPFHLQITMITGMSHEWISSAGVFKYVYMCFSSTILFFFFFYLPFSYDPEQFADTHTPILVIGTKVDLAQVVNNSVLKRSASIAEECGADELNLVQLENYVKCSNTCNYISLHNET